MVAVGVEMYSRAAMPDKTALFLQVNLTSSLQKKKKKKKPTTTTKKKHVMFVRYFRKGEIIDKKATTTTNTILTRSVLFLAFQSYPVLKCISPSGVLYLFSIFIFPCICFDGADPRNNLIDQCDAAVRNRCCTQA